MIHSFRKEENSTFPLFTDQEAIQGLEMIKKIKTEISSDSIFFNDEFYTLNKLLDGKAIFINYWAYPIDYSTYRLTSLPRGSQEILVDSISAVKTINIGINKYISKEHIKVASEIIEYLTSRDVQRKYADQASIISSMKDIYNEGEKICQLIDCSFIQKAQEKGNVVLNDLCHNPDSEKIKNHIYDYLFRNRKLSVILKQINDLTKVYTISIKPNKEDGNVGFYTFIFLVSITMLMAVSIVFLFIENFNPFFKFLSQDQWLLNVLGNILIMGGCFVKYGEVTNLKCHLNTIFLSLGFTISYMPILYTLILYFPNENFPLSQWAYKHKILFFTILISVDIISFIFSSTQPFTLIKNIDANDLIFYTCGTKKLRILVYLMIIIYKFIIIFIIVFLIFIDWNVEVIHYDLKFIVSGLYSIVIALTISFGMKVVVINSFSSDFIIRIIIISMAVMSNYIFIYGYRVILGLLHKQNVKMNFINRINDKFINSDYKSNCKNNKNSEFKTTEFKNTLNTINEEKEGDNDSIHSSNKTKSEESSIIKKNSRAPSMFLKMAQYHSRRISFSDIKAPENDNNNYY